MRRHTLSLTCGLLALGLSALPAAAQVDPLSTTAGLKAACERNAGNRVLITNDMSVSTGRPADAPEQVNTGCVIELAPDADLQFNKVGLAFAGPLRIVGGTKSGLQMQEASLAAPTVQVLLTALESSVKMERSRMDATTGALDLQLGFTSKIEVSGARTGGSPLSQAAFAAAGRIVLSAARWHSAVYKDTGIVAGDGIELLITSGESSLIFENAGAYSDRSDVRFDIASSRSKLEISQAAITAVAGRVSLGVQGNDSGMKVSNTVVQAGGSVQLASLGPKGDLLFTGGSITAGAGILLDAYSAGFDGNLLVKEVQIRGGADIRMLSGLRGKTGVFNNNITGAGPVRAATNTWGVCEASGNAVAAPLVQLCL